MRPLDVPRSRRGQHLDARAVLLACLALILAVKACQTPLELAWAGAVLAGIGFAFGIPWRSVIRRSLWVLPFCLAALPLLFSTPGPVLWRAGPLAISAAGLEKFEVVGVQCLLCLLLVLMTSSICPPFSLVQAMGRLGCPQRLVAVLVLCLRYLEMLSQEMVRLQRARSSRGVREPGLRFRARVTGQLVATLFLRSLDRAERVEMAMRSRGASGEYLAPAAHPPRWGARETLTLGAALFVTGISWSL